MSAKKMFRLPAFLLGCIILFWGCDGLSTESEPPAGYTERTLRVFSHYENALLGMAATAFERTHPGVTVEYSWIPIDSAMTYSDVVRQLNLDLVGGTGPDVLILDDLPIAGYVNKGLLKDLTGLIDTSAMYEVFSAGLSGTGQFMVPASARIPVIFGRDDSIKTIDSLLRAMGGDAAIDFGQLQIRYRDDNVAETENPPTMFSLSVTSFMQVLWDIDGEAILVDETLDTERLEQFFRDTLKYSELMKHDKETVNHGYDAGGKVPTGDIQLTLSINETSRAAFIGLSKYGVESVKNIDTLLPMLYPEAFEEITRAGSFGVTSLGRGQAAGWIPVTMLSVPAAGKQEDLAIEFVQFMLTDEVQGHRYQSSLDLFDGIPVTRKGVQSQISQIKTALESEDVYLDSGLVANEIDALLVNYTSMHIPSNDIKFVVLAAGRKLCAGEIDIGAAVAQVQRELDLYLKEMA